MLHRTYVSALDERPSSCFAEKVIMRVRLKDGREFYRTYAFDADRHKCRACRGSERARYRGLRSKLPSTGHTCQQCGNPYAGFVRRHVRRTATGWDVLESAWSSSGRLH